MAKKISKWRMRCETENAYVYQWSEGVPTTCPNSVEHTIDTSRTVGVSQVEEQAVAVNNLPLSPFDRMLTSEETVLLSLKPGMGVSALRDVIQVQNGGSVTNTLNRPEYVFATTGPGSVATMKTAERCRYMPGLASEVGIGGHLDQMLVGDQALRFGVFDDTNGFLFEILANDLYVIVRKDGVDTRTVRSEFNMDCLDGSGPSGVFMNALKGYIWVIRWCWYGYGSVDFSIITEDDSQQQRTIVLHRYFTQVRPSISVPNLPMTITLNSGQTDTLCRAYVTGRKYSVLGKFTPMTRMGSVQKVVTSADVGWLCVCSIRRKVGYSSAPVLLNTIDVFGTSGVTVFKVVTGTQLTGAVWGAPDCYDDHETAVQYDDSAAAVTGGTTIWKGAVRSHAKMAAMCNCLDFYLTEEDVLSVFVMNPASVGETLVSIKWKEQW
jgi:hypothetical protein